MLGRREIVAAGAAAAMAGLAAFVAGVDRGDVVEVRVAGRSDGAPAVTPVPPGAMTGTEPAPQAGRVVWAEKGDVWLYDSRTGQRRPLTSDGDARDEFHPRFRESNRVTYLAASEPYGQGSDLMEIDLVTGQRRLLRRLAVGTAHDWSPDSETLAVYGTTPDGQSMELHIIGDGPPRVRQFKPILGRGGFVNYDETRIEWSPDGRHLLLLDTALDTQQDETLYILTADGRDAVPARPGTWARWSADGGTIYCLCGRAADTSDWTWQAIDFARRTTKPLPIPAASRPSLSPDGRFLAFDDGQDTPEVHVLDLQHQAGRPRFLARAALAPIWLSSTGLAVTDTRPCRWTEDQCIAGGHGSMFESAGTASAIDITTARRSPLPPIDTDGADTAPIE